MIAIAFELQIDSSDELRDVTKDEFVLPSMLSILAHMFLKSFELVVKKLNLLKIVII